MITFLLAVMTIFQSWRAVNWIVEAIQAETCEPTHYSYLMMNPLYAAVCGDPECPCSYTGICTKNLGPEIGCGDSECYSPECAIPDRWVKEY